MAGDVEKLLLGFAQVWARRHDYDTESQRRQQQTWLGELASAHARALARCILHRALECRLAAPGGRRPASLTDADDALQQPPRGSSAAR